MQFDPVPIIQTIDFSPIFVVAYIAAYVSSFTDISVALIKVSSNTLLINTLGGLVPHPAP